MEDNQQKEDGRNIVTPPIAVFSYSVITWSVNNDEYVSAAPRNWINEERHTCMWPKNKKIERKAINLSMKPEEDWNEIQNITIVGHYATLTEANEVEKRKTKTTSESDAAAFEEINKRRKTKNKKYRDDSISPPPTFQQTTHSSNDHEEQEADNKYIPGAAVSDVASDHIDVTILESRTSTPEDIRRAQITLLDDKVSSPTRMNSETSSTTRMHSETSSTTEALAEQLSQVLTELKNLYKISVFTMHRVENIEDNLKKISVPSQSENIPSLLPDLPLMELCQLKSLEEKMADEQFKKQLFNMLKYTGGSKERDCVNRCLEKIFTNYLAQFCSWTGKKNNFKLSSLNIMTTIKREGSRGAVRPRSARAAHAALAGAPPPPAPDAMQLRRALASKLKAEVVDKH